MQPIKSVESNAIRYDLHCHSTVSDGVLSPTEVVKRAAEKGVNVLALTDHDSIAGLAEAREQAKEAGIDFINGVEISTCWQNRSIHVVGLNFDPYNPCLNHLLAKQAEIRQQRAWQIGEQLAKIGISDSFAGAQQLTIGEVTRAHYARYLVQIGKVKDVSQAFSLYLSKNKPGYVEAQWCDISDAINVIHQAAGMAVVAHPLRYKFTIRWVKKLLADFKSLGGDGVEVSSCGQNNQQRQLLANLAEQFDLKASAGSDFHFACSWIELGNWIELGKSLTLPDNCQPIWNAW